MRIAILTPTLYGFDGMTKLIKVEAEDYIAQGNTVTVFGFAGGDFKSENVGLEVLSAPKSLFWRRIYRLLFPLDIFNMVKCIMKLKDYDLIISHDYPVHWLAHMTRKFCNVKYVYRAHGLRPASLFPRFYERAYMRVTQFLWRRSVSNADVVMAVSNFLREELKTKYNIDSQVVYDKFAKSVFHPGIDGSKIRDEYGLNEAPVILFVGRLDPFKGVHLLIEAFNTVRTAIPRAKLLIVGKATHSYYLKLVKEKGNDSVILADYVKDEELPYYYAACDVYATASLNENFNRPLVEAQACGKPVVAFNLCAHPEVVQQDITGFLVEPRDSKQLAEAIIKILNDKSLAQRMGEAGYKRAKEVFDI